MLDYRQFSIRWQNCSYYCDFYFKHNTAVGLVDVKAAVTATLRDGTEKKIEQFWAVWQPGKEQSLGFGFTNVPIEKLWIRGGGTTDDKRAEPVQFDVFWRVGTGGQ